MPPAGTALLLKSCRNSGNTAAVIVIFIFSANKLSTRVVRHWLATTTSWQR